MVIHANMLVALIFEVELAAYFEATMGWQSGRGEKSANPGFRTEELHMSCMILFRLGGIPHWRNIFPRP